MITPDPSVSRRLYVDARGLPLTAEGDDYLHSEDIDGSKSFGVWPLAQAAQACFGAPDWPADRAVPQASIEFEVADADTVQVAADELKEKGFALLHEARTEPWGQTVARLQSSEGAIIGLSYAPSMPISKRATSWSPPTRTPAGRLRSSRSKGLVTEVGGLMTHGAVIARSTACRPSLGWSMPPS